MRNNYKKNYIGKSLEELEDVYFFERYFYNSKLLRHIDELISCWYSFEYHDNYGYIPVKLYVENDKVIDACRTFSVSSEDKEALKKALINLDKHINSQYKDKENNYALCYYACGYNGNAQQAMIKKYEERGIRVW